MQVKHSSHYAETLWITPEIWKSFDLAKTSAHRVGSLHGAWLERLGNDLLFNFQTPELLEQLQSGWLQRSPLFPFAPGRIFHRELPLQNQERSAPTLKEGSPDLPNETVVSENGVLFGVDFSAGYSVGLFLDQRANRAITRSRPVKRLLNTFAYTCSFSVMGALGGAETLSVDLSKKSLDRGRLNFQLNGIDPEPHRFVADDVLEFLPRLARRKELFDIIILDPPTFSRGNKGRKFRAEEDLQLLLEAALPIAAPGAQILLSTNCTKITGRDLQQLTRLALKTARRGGTTHFSPQLADFPASAGASTLWIQLH